MGAEAHLDWRAAAASALAWWNDAGVDTLVDEAPRDWLSAAAVAATAPLADPSPSSAMPDDLAAFQRWRHTAAMPEAAWPGDWLAPSGPAGAALMVLVDCPDREDREALLSGPAGLLFDRMLTAIGLHRDQVMLAALCAKRPVAGRLPAAVTARLAELAVHHVELVAPRRLLVLGNAASRALLGMDVSAARGRLQGLNLKDRRIEAVASFHPRFLLEKPAAKAAAWADLQMLRRGLGQ